MATEAQELQEALGKARSEISGLNRKIGVLQAEKAEALTYRRRLDRIERAYNEKERRLELDYYAKGKAREAGIPFELLDGLTFEDEASVDDRLRLVAEREDELRLQAVREQLGTSHQPMSGQEPDELPKTEAQRFEHMFEHLAK